MPSQMKRVRPPKKANEGCCKRSKQIKNIPEVYFWNVNILDNPKKECATNWKSGKSASFIWTKTLKIESEMWVDGLDKLIEDDQSNDDESDSDIQNQIESMFDSESMDSHEQSQHVFSSFHRKIVAMVTINDESPVFESNLKFTGYEFKSSDEFVKCIVANSGDPNKGFAIDRGNDKIRPIDKNKIDKIKTKVKLPFVQC